MKRLIAALILLLSVSICAAVSAEIIPPHGEGQIGLQAVVLCDELTVRSAPDASAGAVKKLHAGDTFIVQEQTDDWANCFLSDAVDAEPAGWVDKDYIAIDPAWYITREKTPVYAWDSASAPRVALLSSDVTLPVLKAENGWLTVSLRGASGWIYDTDAGYIEINAASMQDGDRFEANIMLEGMEETVLYEHVLNASIGYEMDYEYESLTRETSDGTDRFVSVYDDPAAPENYIEIAYSAENAETVEAAVMAELSSGHEAAKEPCTLERAGECVIISAAGSNEALQEVYILAADDGCRVISVHYTLESAEGFGMRFAHMLETFEVIPRQGE